MNHDCGEDSEQFARTNISKVTVRSLFGVEGNDYEINFVPESDLSIIYGWNGMGKTTVLKLIDAALNQKYQILDYTQFKELTIEFDQNENDEKALLVVYKPIMKSFDEMTMDDLENIRQEKSSEQYLFSLFVRLEFHHYENGIFVKDSNKTKDKILKVRKDRIHCKFSCKDIQLKLQNSPKMKFRDLLYEKLSETSIYDNYIAPLLFENVSVAFDDDSANLSFASLSYMRWFSDFFGFSNSLYVGAYKNCNEMVNKNDNTERKIIPEFIDYSEDYEKKINEIKMIIEYYEKEISKFGLPNRTMRSLKYLSNHISPNCGRSDIIRMLFVLQNAIQFLITDVNQLIADINPTDINQDIFSLQYNNCDKSIQLFCEIINEKIGLTDKDLFFNEKEKKFETICLNGDHLNLEKLSTGEQKLVSIFFEVIFKVKGQKYILLDEPESSLHIGWQEKIIDEILYANRMMQRDVQVIISTHSPNIVGCYGEYQIPIRKVENE